MAAMAGLALAFTTAYVQPTAYATTTTRAENPRMAALDGRHGHVATAVTTVLALTDAAVAEEELTTPITDSVVPDVALSAASVPDVAMPEIALPEIALPSVFEPLVAVASNWVNSEMLPVVVTSVLLPLSLFAALLLYDGIGGIAALVRGDERPVVPTPGPPEEGSVAVPADTFQEELSAWPALLEIQASLAEMAPAEQRRVKLEKGTNWPPRTPTERPFDVMREGYMFFQGPTPRTSVQPELPSFLSARNFEERLAVPPALKLAGGVGSLTLLVVLFVLVTDGVVIDWRALDGIFALLPSIELPAIALPSIELPSIELPSVELPSIELPSVELPSLG